MIINLFSCITVDVTKSANEIFDPFFALIDEHIYGVPLETKLNGIIFSPTIVDPAMGAIADRTTYRRSEPVIAIGINIPHGDWIRSDRLGRVNLLEVALKKGIENIKSSKLSATDKEKLKHVIELSGQSLSKKFAK